MALAPAAAPALTGAGAASWLLGQGAWTAATVPREPQPRRNHAAVRQRPHGGSTIAARGAVAACASRGHGGCAARGATVLARGALVAATVGRLRRAAARRRLSCTARRASAAAAVGAATFVAREPQVLSFVDPETGSEVVLVACMHYNPCSVAKAAQVTRRLSELGALGAVVLETCPTRWEALTFDQPAGSQQRWLLDNEFQAAADVAEAAGRPVVLGDQSVEELGKDVGAIVQETFSDLASPLQGGWQRTIDEILGGWKRLRQSGEPLSPGQEAAQRPAAEGRPSSNASAASDRLELLDFFDVGFLLGFPVALVRYALTWLVKSPRFFTAVCCAFAVLKALLSEPPDQLPGSSPVADVTFVLVEVVTWRILLGALLMERDVILAKSISDTCKTSGGPGRAVVAVLGMAHCNAVKKIMLADVQRGGVA